MIDVYVLKLNIPLCHCIRWSYCCR